MTGIWNWRLPSLGTIKDQPRYLGDCCLIDGVEHVWLQGQWHKLKDVMQTTWNVEMTEQSLGQRRVRHTFNPGGNALVDEIKVKSAELIDLVEKNKALDPRLAALAQTHYEDAAMWAVKLVTS